MLRFARALGFLILISVPLVVNAATRPAARQITPKEKAQGFSDRVILAKPRAAETARLEAEESADRTVVRERFPRLGGLRIIEVAPTDTVDATIARLAATGRYEFVERDVVFHTDAVPNDPTYPKQWSLHNTGQVAGATAGADIAAPAAWDIIHGSPDVIIALVDSGVRTDHWDIAPNLWKNPAPTFNDINGASIIDGVRSGDVSDSFGHGTHVAGIICAAGNNGIGTTGVTWQAQLMVLKNSNAEDGSSLASDSAACIDYAVTHGARIINCSFGGTSYSASLYTAIKAARDAGVLVVAAAGNAGSSNDAVPHYPSNYLLDNIIAVGNSTAADAPSISSDYGALVDLFAPGTAIVSTDFANSTGSVVYSGTSMAAPHVTGALALLMAHAPGETYLQIKNRLLCGVDLRASLAGRAVTNGRLNVYNALSASSDPFNNSYATRAIITGTHLALRANNTGKSAVSGDEPAHLGDGVLWWQWIAPTAGTYSITTVGSDYDTALEVYSGTPTGAASALTLVSSNDNDGAAKTSRVAITATKGSSYFIASSGIAHARGYTQLNIALVPPNDNFTDATLLSGASAHTVGENIVATRETGEPRVMNTATANSIWYKWTAPKTGHFQISTFSDDFDTVLGVYTGDSVDALTLVAAGDDTNASSTITNTDSRCSITAALGTTYYFQVGSKTTAAHGSVVISITDSLWQFTDGGAAFAGSPAIGADGTIYIASAAPDSRLYAVTPAGALKWSYAADGSLNMATPTIGTDGTIYIGTSAGTLVGLNRDGTVKWSRSLTANWLFGGIAAAPDGTLYAHDDGGYLFSVSPTDGTVRWKLRVGTYSTLGGPVVGSDGTVYQGSDDDKCLYAITPTGEIKWTYTTGMTTDSTPALDYDGNIYFATNGRVYSFTPSGAQRWSYTLPGSTPYVSSSPVLSPDGATVYIGALDGVLRALSSATGLETWKYTCGNAIFGSVPTIDANGVIYVGDYDGKLYAITATGTLQRTWDTELPIWSSPVIDGTTLYVGSDDHKLYAFEVGAPAAGGPWPTFRQNSRRSGRLVTDALAITRGPESVALQTSTSSLLTVSATGQGPLKYQWTKDGAVINGATGSTLLVSGSTPGVTGAYAVTVAGPQGTVTSSAGVVGLANPGRLANLSIRSQAGTGAQTLIVGISIGGGVAGSTKPLLVRGIGPTLTAFGLQGVIAAPVLTVMQNGAPVVTNAGWAGDAKVTAIGTQVGAFPLASSTSLDAALVTEMNPAVYSVQLTGKTGPGIAMVEVYDATTAEIFSTGSARLINMSARTQVGTGGDVLIAGFSVVGSQPRKVLIRAVGPTLAAFGVDGTLADPQLTLYAGGATKLAENDNWADDVALVAAAKSVSAFGLAAGSKDAALIATLPAGTYSAVVRGVGDTTGVALVEVYELP